MHIAGAVQWEQMANERCILAGLKYYELFKLQ